MQDYNLTAEIKKISGAINNSSPNTELGNINGSVGNLDTAMQGVATAIGNISIPNTGSNIDGVATAINNKSIPDPSTNITAVANAIVSMAGGKDLDDLITILTTMNGNIANLGSNHIIDLTPTTGGYTMARGNGGVALLPNEARYTSYTDTNNIGATDVQSAVDYITKTNSTTGFIKTEQVTITTDANNGVAALGKTIADVTILSIFIDAPSVDIPLLFRSGPNWYVKIIAWGGSNYTPMVNYTCTLNLVYIDN